MYITISMEALYAAFLAWELDRRDGKCTSEEGVNAATTEEVAKQTVATLLEYLVDTSI